MVIMKIIINHPRCIRAFSMVELLIVVASLAVIGALAVLTIGGAHSDLRESKLKGDVAQINTAIDVFLSNGGSLDEISTAEIRATCFRGHHRARVVRPKRRYPRRNLAGK